MHLNPVLLLCSFSYTFFLRFCFVFCHTHDFFFSWPEPGEISNPFFSFPIHLSCFLYFGLAMSLRTVYLIGAGLTQHPNPLITEAKKIEVNFPLALIAQGWCGSLWPLGTQSPTPWLCHPHYAVSLSRFKIPDPASLLMCAFCPAGRKKRKGKTCPLSLWQLQEATYTTSTSIPW